jgi:hypothetical protein
MKIVNEKQKDKVIFVLNQLVSTSCRRMAEGKYSYNSVILGLHTRWRWMVSLTSQEWVLQVPSGWRSWVGPRSSLDIVEKRKSSFYCWDSSPEIPGRGTCGPSLYTGLVIPVRNEEVWFVGTKHALTFAYSMEHASRQLQCGPTPLLYPTWIMCIEGGN